MESENNKPSVNRVESHGSNVKTAKISYLFLRFLAIVTTLVAATVMGVNKETVIIQPFDIEATAKSKHLSAAVYFIISNAIACAYAAISLIVSIRNRGGSKGVKLIIVILDLIMVGLLFSGNGAAAAVGVLGYKGNSHVQWNKVCNVFGIFCGKYIASVSVSLIGSLIFIILIIFAIL